MPAPAIEDTTTQVAQLAANATSAATLVWGQAQIAPHALPPGIGSSQATNASAAFVSTKQGFPSVPPATIPAAPVKFPRPTALLAYTPGIGARMEIPAPAEIPTTKMGLLQCVRLATIVAHHA